MTKEPQIIKYGKFIAISSLIFGTILLLIYYLTMSTESAVFSYFLLIIVAIINFGFLIALVIKYFQSTEYKNQILKTIGILLINIPIAVLYFYIVVSLTNIIRLKITNKTNTDLTNILIGGCEKKQIDKLKINESETIWIKIPNDCSIYAEYQIDGKIKSEKIFGYVTNMMGQKVSYEIGIENKPLDTEF